MIGLVTIQWQGVVAMAALALLGIAFRRRWPLYLLAAWVVLSVLGLVLFGIGSEVGEPAK